MLLSFFVLQFLWSKKKKKNHQVWSLWKHLYICELWYTSFSLILELISVSEAYIGLFDQLHCLISA